jgi:hypothetical protein
MNVRACLTRLSLAIVSLCLGGVWIPASAFQVVPHRAVYDLSFGGSNGRGDVVDVTGTMAFDWEDSCDGWNVTQRTVMSFAYSSGDTIDVGWNVVTWEAKDGLRYRYFVRNFENGEVKEEFRGEARLDGPGESGVAQYSLPQGLTVALPAGTLFPTAHTIELLKRIEAGDSFFWATIFDGFNEDGLSDINAVVTTRHKTEAAAPGRLPLLAATPSTGVRLAFFDHANESAEPDQEQQFRLHLNGIVETIVFDFGDFNVDGKLRELKELPSPC